MVSQFLLTKDLKQSMKKGKRATKIEIKICLRARDADELTINVNTVSAASHLVLSFPSAENVYNSSHQRWRGTLPPPGRPALLGFHFEKQSLGRSVSALVCT